jgi:hypothetical protein
MPGSAPALSRVNVKDDYGNFSVIIIFLKISNTYGTSQELAQVSDDCPDAMAPYLNFGFGREKQTLRLRIVEDRVAPTPAARGTEIERQGSTLSGPS